MQGPKTSWSSGARARGATMDRAFARLGEAVVGWCSLGRRRRAARTGRGVLGAVRPGSRRAAQARADVARDVAALGLVVGGRPAAEEVAVAGVAQAPQRELDTVVERVEAASHGSDGGMESRQDSLVPEERWKRARGGCRELRRRGASGRAGRRARGYRPRRRRARGGQTSWGGMVRSKTGNNSAVI